LGAGVGLALGLLGAIPTGGLSLIGVILAGGVGAAVGSFFRKGLSDDEKKRISDELDAGHAAVGVMADPGEEADGVIAKLKELGGRTEAHDVSKDALEEVAAKVPADGTPPPPSA
jgi:uncharacterized membrane protein